MPKQLYVVSHDGHTFHRMSERRVYTHAVLVMYDVERSRAAEQALARKRWQRDHAYSVAVVAGADETLNRWQHESTQEHASRVERMKREEREWLANPAHTEEAFVAKWLQQFEDGIIGYRSSDGRSYYRLPNWCSRLDLAEKLASSALTGKRRSHEAVQEALILPASVKTKRQQPK